MEEEVLGIRWVCKIEEKPSQEQIRIPKLLTNLQTTSIELPTKS